MSWGCRPLEAGGSAWPGDGGAAGEVRRGRARRLSGTRAGAAVAVVLVTVATARKRGAGPPVIGGVRRGRGQQSAAAAPRGVRAEWLSRARDQRAEPIEACLPGRANRDPSNAH